MVCSYTLVILGSTIPVGIRSVDVQHHCNHLVLGTSQYGRWWQFCLLGPRKPAVESLLGCRLLRLIVELSLWSKCHLWGASDFCMCIREYYRLGTGNGVSGWFCGNGFARRLGKIGEGRLVYTQDEHYKYETFLTIKLVVFFITTYDWMKK